ncbi:MAG: glycosyltransferase family 2 protein [Oligoflexia bacterium]|nr:glycosyltransferase family 2 protein [Oligoflexia bacterium]
MLSILIPVYNEEAILEGSVLKVHGYLKERGLEHEVIVVSNGSTDGTEQHGRALAASHTWFRFLALPQRSVGQAFKHGVREARGEFVVSLDVDLSCELTFIDYAAELLRHADVLVGSKTMGNQKRSVVRVLGSQLYILSTLLFFDLTISDYSIGSKAYRRAALLPALEGLDDWTGYVFELCLYAKKQGLKTVQIGIDCNDTRKSRFNLLHEGLYRYWHLYKCWRRLKAKK